MPDKASDIGAVIIGRNEGERLLRCLPSVTSVVTRAVYVDSGSTDGSAKAALDAGLDVVELDGKTPFTAALARNAGFARLLERGAPQYVQFIDGDCELQPNWVEKARAFLEANSRTAVVCGRRRELFPEATIWNRLIDIEWNTPVGPSQACGGDSMMRSASFIEVGGFNNDLIAGEEPELCYRLRQIGWEIHRIDAEMTLHDAEMRRFSQWWKRSRRAGHTYAEGVAMYGLGPARYNVPRLRSTFLWGIGVPLGVILGTLATPWSALLLLTFPIQVLKLNLRGESWERAFFLTLGKLPEAQGALGYWIARLRRRKIRLIEYK